MTSTSKIWKELTSILSNLKKIHSPEVVDRVSETQLQVSENSDWIIWRLKCKWLITGRYPCSCLDMIIFFSVWQTICDPCAVKYDYVAHLETLRDDLKVLLPKLNATTMLNSFPEANVRTRGDTTKYNGMYKDIPPSILDPVLKKFSLDADMFGYSFDDYLSNTWHNWWLLFCNHQIEYLFHYFVHLRLYKRIMMTI